MASSSRPSRKPKVESTTVPNWIDLPRDVTANILHRLGAFEILMNARNVCPLWWNICKDPLMWRTIHMSKVRSSPNDLVKICLYAVDRSCGHLEDIDIEEFGTDDLLEYIVDSTSHLRRIRLANCWEISNLGICDVSRKLPLLEELDISYSVMLTEESLEVLGQCCPLLKSLKYSRVFVKRPECDDEAFAIAKTMHNLCHLNIFGNLFTNVGLLAILDGCPLLESLDLRACPRLDLSGSLGKRCHEQIKDLLLPTDLLRKDDSYLDSLSDKVDDDDLFFLHDYLTDLSDEEK